MHFLRLLPTKYGQFGLVAVAALGLLVALPGNAQAAESPAPLGSASSFVVLAGTTVTNTGPSTLNGDLGLYPGTSITGTGSMTLNGTNHAGDSVTQGAKTDLVTAYNSTAGRGPTSPISDDLGGKTLTPGVYNSASSIGLTGVLLLDAADDPNAVFVFQAGSTLDAATGSKVLLRNGARSCNVFWQVGSSATLGTGSAFIGTIMAQESITLNTGAKLIGRALARDATVTLDTNTITRPTACTASSTPSASPSPQVTEIPSGGVSAGDGSTASGGQTPLILLAGGLVIAGFGGATVVATRRRRVVANRRAN